MLTGSEGELDAAAASVDYIRPAAGGALDLGAALAELGERYGVRLLLCEGGPHLGRELLGNGLLDELFLSLSPKLAGGDPGAGGGAGGADGGGRGGRHAGALRILAGPELDPAVELELLGVHNAGSHLFLRYAVLAPERVSRETISKSSPAR